MTTLNSPQTYANSTSDLGNPFQYLDAMVLQRLTEKFDMEMSGLVAYLGDLSGSGSDTGRIRNATGFGFARRMASMATETSTVTASTWEAAYDSISVARKGLAFEQSWQREILQNDGIDIVKLANSIADSVIATLRYLVCQQGATFSTNAFDDTATVDMDDVINLRNLYEATAGFTEGGVVNVVSFAQMKQIKAAQRVEAAFKFPDSFNAQQATQAASGFKGSFLGMDWYTSTDVVLNTDYYGFSYVKGAIGYAVANTQKLARYAEGSALLVPPYGLIINIESEAESATVRATGNAWMGVTSLSATVAPQFLLRSNVS